MKRRKFLRKTVAGALVFVMCSTNTMYVAKNAFVYASQELDVESHTNVKDVDANILLVNNGQKAKNIVADVSKSDQKLIGTISMKREGYIQKGEIEIVGQNSRVFSIENPNNNSLIEKVEGNKITLNRFSGTTVNFELPLKYIYEGNISKDILSNNLTAKFRATYVSPEGKVEEVSKDIALNIEWVEERKPEVKAEIIKYVKTNTEKGNNVVIQIVIDVKNGATTKNLPIEKLSVSSIQPSLEGKLPDKVNVSLLSTKGVNEELPLDQKEENVKYNNLDGTLNVDIENKMSEDKTYAKGNGTTKLLVTSVYENVQNVKDEYNVALNVKAQEKLLNSDKAYNAEFTGSANLSKPLGSLISASYETDKTSMSKGKLYMNSISNDKSEIEFNNKLNINTSVANINGTIEINDNLPYYNDNKQNYESGMSYKSVRVSKQEFENVLGKDGKLDLLNEKGQIIATIDSSSKLEGENYVIDLKEDTKTINYRSSKILKEGNIVIKESRKITTSRYPINLLKDLNKLTFNKEVNIVINNNGKEEKVKIADAVSNIELLNTKTKATLRTNKQELYSVVENNDVEFVIELNNNKEESDIYGTSVYEIVLPNNIKDIKIKDTNILYGEGLKIENTSVYTRDGKKVIRVLVSGVQQSVNKGHLTNGTNLVVNTDISVDEETPKQEIQYNLVYSNVNATTYEQAAEFMLGSQNEAFRRFGNGIASTKAKIASPEGLVVANRYKNYSDVGAEVVTIKQGNKDAILKAGHKARTISKQVLMINNLNTELPNARLLGRLPVEGVVNVETGQSLNNNLNITLASGINKVDNSNIGYDVYYSENVNATVDLNNAQNGWTKNPNDLSKVKSYMIAFKESIKPGQVNKFNLNLNLPANIDYNKSTVGTDQVIFDVNTAKGVEQYTSWSDMIRLTTGEGVSLSGKITPEVKKVEQGKEVRYTYEVKNEAKTLKAKNVENYVESPAGFELVKIETPTKEIPFSRDSDGNIKFGMEDIEAGESRQVRLTFKAIGTQGLELKIRTRAEGTTVVKETRADKVEVAVKEAEVEINAKGTTNEEDMQGVDKYKENSEPTFEIVTRKSYVASTNIKNVKMKIKTSGNLKIEDIQKDLPESNVVLNKINEQEYEISNIDLSRARMFDVKTKVSIVEQGKNYTPIMLRTEIYNEKGEMIDNKEYTGYIVKSIITMEQSVDKNKTYVEENEKIEYTYKIRNEGTADAYSKFVFNAPQGARILSESGATKNVTKEFTLQPNETKEIKVQVELGKNNGVDRVSISANAELYNEAGQKVMTTNPITQIVEKNSDTRRKEDLVRQGKLKLSEEELKSLGIAETRKEEQKLVRNYEISGKAWDDVNKNGIYDEGERPLSNVVAKLVENGKNRVVKTVLTDDTGKYTFSEVPNGEYSVMFEFEDKKYSPTVYKKNNIEDSKVSDALGVNRQETTKQVAVSDAIKINFQSKSDENLGLVNNTNFDMALKGEISKLRVVNGDKKDEITTKEVESTVNKFKVSPFTSGNSKVEVDYKLIAKNEGNVPGKITKIGAYKNKDEKILTASWKEETGELAVTKELENIELKPGEEKEITVTVETTMDKVLNKVLSNRFEILGTTNNLGVKDINSVEGNNSTNENDNVALDVIVNKDYTIILLAIFAVIAAVAISFREKIMKLFKKKENTKDKNKDKEERKEEANDKE